MCVRLSGHIMWCNAKRETTVSFTCRLPLLGFVTDVCPAPSTLCLQLTTTSTMEVIDLIGQEYMT